jgi:hypothetical protein
MTTVATNTESVVDLSHLLAEADSSCGTGLLA